MGEKQNGTNDGTLHWNGRRKLAVRYNSCNHIIITAAIFLSCFVLAFAAGSFVIQPQGAKAVTGLNLVSSSTMTLATNNNNIVLFPIPNINGGLASASHALIASTNVPTGYTLALSLSGTPALATTTGNIISPTPLDNNTWGYALASTSAVGVVNDFDASYAVPTPASTSRWANPDAAANIKSTNTVADNDTTDIYYGAKVDMSLASGTYASRVAYTAVANMSVISAPSVASITPTYGTTAGGTAIEIRGTGFTASDQSITTAVTIGGVNCTSVSISSNTPITGQDTIYCNTPAHAAGAVDVIVTTWGGTATVINGYTYIVPANVTSVSPSIASTVAGTESGPAFTIVGTGFSGTSAAAVTNVTIGGIACASFTVVSDTQIFCKAPNTINTTGNKAIVVTKSSIASIGTVNVAYNSTSYPTLQASNAYASCATTAKIFRDTRDSQLYYVKKMPDNKCWMVDNLKYANYGNLSQETGKYLTADGTDTESAANWDVAKYVDPGATNYCTGNTNMPANTNTRCGLLYNWYAATNGTGTYSQNTWGDQATGDICPAGFRLPSSFSGTSGPTTSGTEYTAADFPVLNASMNAGASTTGAATNYYAGWQPSGTWGGVFSGGWGWGGGFAHPGIAGFFWSSTAYSAMSALILNFNSGSVYPGGGISAMHTGSAVRCVMDAPPTPPAGTNPPNISSTNPAVLDVYPTTGWEGDVVAITSNALFTNVANVTIGGTACTEWGVVNTSLITCKLPAKTAGSANDIAVINNNVNVTPANTYAHMRVTYFNPNSNTVNIGGTNYSFYPNGFTSTNCSAMTPNNDPIGSTPAASLAYVRDTRNNQTYKVKKMADNKCWMVDNLKYIDTQITNTADNTTGMTYNNGDHLGNGGTTAYNTVSEAYSPTDDANWNKAFFNNPMSTANCYGSIYMPSGTLTHCGYLYNWYAATNGTGTYSQSTHGNQATENICPANFRLPSAMSDGSTPTSNGTSYNAADIVVLNASMNAGSLTIGNITNYYTGWQPSGAWGGALSGSWDTGLGYQGNVGYFWSSTVAFGGARHFLFGSRSVGAGEYATSKNYGFAVRCVLN